MWKSVPVVFPSRSSFSFLPPPMDMWHPALNRTDWMPPDLFCDLGVDYDKYTLPALPFASGTSTLRMDFPPPAGLMQCVSESALLASIDWRAARSFSADMLVGMATTRSVQLLLHAESLYDGMRPIPLGFFDPLPPSVTIQGSCRFSCAERIAAKCPYFVDGGCRPCPPGSHKRVIQNTYAYCSPCPIGSHCNSDVSVDPIACPCGTFQPERGQTRCLLCPAGPSHGTCANGPDHALCSVHARAHVARIYIS